MDRFPYDGWKAGVRKRQLCFASSVAPFHFVVTVRLKIGRGGRKKILKVGFHMIARIPAIEHILAIKWTKWEASHLVLSGDH